jgi:hypothetical protein
VILAVFRHGAIGILDEVLLYGLIVVIIVIVALLLRPSPPSATSRDAKRDHKNARPPLEDPGEN